MHTSTGLSWPQTNPDLCSEVASLTGKGRLMFFVQCPHNECEATLQIANGPVKSFEGSFMGMALGIFWVQGSGEDVRNSEKCNAYSFDTASDLREKGHNVYTELVVR